MAYRVDLTKRAADDLRSIFVTINAVDIAQARDWFNGLEALIFSLDKHPARGAIAPEDPSLRHLVYGKARIRYRIIYEIDVSRCVVTVLHIRHGARDAFSASEDELVPK